MTLPRLIVFSSGTSVGGGSGFEKLVFAAQERILRAHIVAVVSNHASGGVKEKADRLRIPFVYFPSPYTFQYYQKIITAFKSDFSVLAGWLKLVSGLNPKTTFNIHPGPLPDFGGKGKYGLHVHRAVIEDYKAGKVTSSAVCMHFVTEEYDQGPVFFYKSVPVFATDTPEDLAKSVRIVEHEFLPVIADLVVNNYICWDGKDPDTLCLPKGYSYFP